MRSLCLDIFKNRCGRIEKNESKYMNFKSMSISHMVGWKAWLTVTVTTSPQKEPFFSVFLFVYVSLLFLVFNLWKSLLLKF